ncbi:hypothetical protein [Nocardia sp. N2S4-5]|uniref:hypothetical protein n=1 Tax=Nocardia sp. N2S4-5 TaxID=3351565 RepID=UPI0037D1C0C4
MTTDRQPRAHRTAASELRPTLWQVLVAATLGALVRGAVLGWFRTQNERRRQTPRRRTATH